MAMNRRKFLTRSGATAMALSAPYVARGQAKGQVTVCSWGGAFMDAQRAAFRGEGAFLGLDVVAATKDADLALAWWDTNALLTAGLSVAGPPPVFPEHGGERGRRQGSNSAGKEGGGKKNARQQ